MTLTQQDNLSVGQTEQMPVNVDDLIRQLDEAYDNYPGQTLRECQRHRELVLPRLIEVLHEAARLGKEAVAREGNAPVFALMLLGEFEAPEALPVLLEFLHLPNDIPSELFGESIHEDVNRVLATLAADQIDLIDRLIADPLAHEYSRWAAVDSYPYLVRDGRISCDDAVSRLRELLRKCVKQADGIIISATIWVLINLNAQEALPEIEDAFQKHLVDEFLVGDLEAVKSDLLRISPIDFPEFKNFGPTKIEDAAAEIRTWNWPEFRKPTHQPPPNRPSPRLARLFHAEPGNFRNDDIEAPNSNASDTARSDARHVGRNDPCPCGSGKKYKKCCLHKATLE
jgi:hypothetical protein